MAEQGTIIRKASKPYIATIEILPPVRIMLTCGERCQCDTKMKTIMIRVTMSHMIRHRYYTNIYEM